MKLKVLVKLLFLALFGIIAAVYILQYSQLLGNTLFLLPSLIAVICGIGAVRAYRLSNVHGKTMSLLTLGLLCFFIGDTIFFLFQFVFHINPFPSVADVFYLAAYPIMLFGFIKEISLHNVSWSNFNKLVLVLSILLLLILAAIVVYFGVFLAYNPGESVISNSIAIAYGIADLILIMPTLFMLKMALDYRGGKLFNSWVLILLALMLMMAADIMFAIFKDKYTAFIWPYKLIDLVWVASYLLFAYSFFYTATTIKEIHFRLRK